MSGRTTFSGRCRSPHRADALLRARQMAPRARDRMIAMSPHVTRRGFLRAAAAMGATFAWSDAFAAPSRRRWFERRDLFAEGVASGDPAPDSVLLWTRVSSA